MDAPRLFVRPEPVVAGVDLKKGKPELASTCAPGLHEVTLGPGVSGLYPLEHAAAGFLRIRVEVLQRMIDSLDLPLCNGDWGDGFWPFFLPMIVRREATETSHYLSEDYAFSERLRQIGVTPMADPSIRLFHIGSYGYTWEDAEAPPRVLHQTFRFKKAPDPLKR